jgi:predicted nucleic acid-binding protein
LRVIDASVVIELLVLDGDPERLGDDELAVPHLIDIEVVHALRGLVRRGELTEVQGGQALDSFCGLTLTRFSAEGLRHRMWALRDNLSAYDATYVALAEILGVALTTTDAHLADAPGLNCQVEVV